MFYQGTATAIKKSLSEVSHYRDGIIVNIYKLFGKHDVSAISFSDMNGKKLTTSNVRNINLSVHGKLLNYDIKILA